MKIGGYVLSTRYLIMVSVLVSSVLLLSLLSTGKTSDSSDFLFFNLGFVGLTFCPLVALYYLASRRFDLALPLPAFALSLLTLMSLALLFDLSDTTLVKDMLGIIHRRFQQPYWQWAGLSLAGLIFLPLLWRALRNTLRSRQYSDLLVCGSFLVFVLLLYLPFGFDSIGLWETWSYRAFLEGQFSWNINHELVTRFWVAVPHLLATIISPDSFIGFHLVHLLIFWAKMVLFYGIMRKLGLLRLHAFLVSIMFMIYPGELGADLVALASESVQHHVAACGRISGAGFPRQSEPIASYRHLARTGFQCRQQRDCFCGYPGCPVTMASKGASRRLEKP